MLVQCKKNFFRYNFSLQNLLVLEEGGMKISKKNTFPPCCLMDGVFVHYISLSLGFCCLPHIGGARSKKVASLPR